MSFYETLADARRSLHENSITALELQVDLMNWLRTTTSVDAYTNFMNVYGYRKVSDPGARRLMGQWLHDSIKKVTETAPTYYVSGDMCSMVKLAATEIDVSEGLQPTDMPTNTGFLVFDRPMTLTGPGGVKQKDGTWIMKGEEVQISAILWEHGEVGQVDEHIVGEDRFAPDGNHKTAPGVKYWLFQTPHDSAVVMNQGMRREAIEQLVAAGVEIVEPVVMVDESTGKEAEWVTESEMRRDNGPLNIYDFSGWSYGQTWAEVPYEEAQEPAEGWDDERQVFLTHPIVNQARRILLATWRMLGQKIVHIEEHKVPRNVRRAAQRVMPCDGDILIIRLRREYNIRLKLEEMGVEGDHGVLWSHRWMVRGHWRRPKNSGPDAPKTEWVSPYIKGPEHLPLVTKDKIFSLEH
jgi:hypothetical protein